MNIPNYDIYEDANTNYKQLCSYMPKRAFRMLICGNSGSGKTNTLIHMLLKPLLHYDKVYLHAKNLEQEKYRFLIDILIRNSKSYPLIECSNDEIVPIDDLDNESQKLVIFDDYICEKNQKPLINYFIRGRHKNCSVIYLSQSFYKTPKDIRLNCSHFCVFEFPSANERNMISRELGVSKEQYHNATKKPYSFLYVDRPSKSVKTNFYGSL